MEFGRTMNPRFPQPMIDKLLTLVPYKDVLSLTSVSRSEAPMRNYILRNCTKLFTHRATPEEAGEFLSKYRCASSVQQLKSSRGAIPGVSEIIIRRHLRSLMLPKSVTSLHIGDLPPCDVEGFVFPDTIKTLNLFGRCDASLFGDAWPRNLVRLTLGGTFSSPLDGIVFPSTLKVLVLGAMFGKPLDNVDFPPNLEELRIGQSMCEQVDSTPIGGTCFATGNHLSFNHPLDRVVFPESLKILRINGWFNQPIHGVSFPASLEELSLGCSFNRPLDAVVFPPNLVSLSVPCFSGLLDNVVFPNSLERFHAHVVTIARKDRKFKCPESMKEIILFAVQKGTVARFLRGAKQKVRLKVAWFTDRYRVRPLPSSLTHLSISTISRDDSDYPFLGNLTSVSLEGSFDERVDNKHFSHGLLELTFGDRFNHPLRYCEFPDTIRRLTLGNAFNQPLVGTTLPASLEYLSIGSSFDQNLNTVNFRNNLQYLDYHSWRVQDFSLLRFPPCFVALRVHKECAPKGPLPFRVDYL